MTSDVLLSQADREEGLSTAYVYAVASFAGYTVSEENLDRSGIDLRIHAGGYGSPAIALQLKATVNFRGPSADGNYRYDVPITNYRRLIGRHQTPTYLLVLALPRNEDEWLYSTDDELVLRRCAYWLSLEGMEESDNSSTVTVRIPPANRFDADALRNLIDQSRQGFVYNSGIGGNDDHNDS